MVFDPQFTPEEPKICEVLTGTEPPLAMQADMRPVADTFRQAAQHVPALLQQLGPLAARDKMGQDGAAAAEIAKPTESMTLAPPYYLPALVDQFAVMAAHVDTTADEFLHHLGLAAGVDRDRPGDRPFLPPDRAGGDGGRVRHRPVHTQHPDRPAPRKRWTSSSNSW